MIPPTPSVRIRPVNTKPLNPAGQYVLYWMVAQRRTTWNFGLQQAITWCHELGRPLLVFEALRSDYEWASDRIHQFVIDGMRDNAPRFDRRGCRYLPYIEPRPGLGRGLLEKLASAACLVVTDDSPSFFLPRMVASAGQRVPVYLEAVDSNGLVPLGLADRTFARAHDFRRFIHRHLPDLLSAAPMRAPLDALPHLAPPSLPEGVRERWPLVVGTVPPVDPHRFPIDHSVAPVPTGGGESAANDRLTSFTDGSLNQYGQGRNHPDADTSSGLSAYLHFGHIGPHAILASLADRYDWTPAAIEPAAAGRRAGWWGMPASAESFLDELVTWREVGFNMAARDATYTTFDSLPAWAQETLAHHRDDPRPQTYTEAEFAGARTHDALWNAAQRQLVREGRMHNYMRMLWGKKILEWTSSPRHAAQIMIELNNRYALDGRDPNSYSGIFWVLGRYDRPWGPERPIFGKIRYMSSANTRRKLHVDDYLRRYGGA